MVASALKVTSEDKALAVLPFFHIYGTFNCFLAAQHLTFLAGAVNLLHHPFTQGASIVIMSRFDPVGFCANIEKHKITFSCIVPPIFIGLVRHPATMKYDLKSLKFLTSGAAPLGGPLVKAVREKLASVGALVEVTQGYGLTYVPFSSHT